MTNRTIYQQRFGPLFLESMNGMFLDELNVVRAEQGMSELTEQEMLDKLETKHNAAIDAENAQA